ncbi:MAG: HesA/MoeB/ThiF family protein [Betaproteobacteria bacterium]|nr:HesA/MoeB/ThiF family protein [Betaproteobacteria bacterium]
MLDEIGLAGQEKLGCARVLIVGAGGLGCPAALLLATAGLGHIIIADDDQVEEANLQRQFLYRAHDVGRPKAEVAAAVLADAGLDIKVTACTERVTQDNIEQLIAGCAVVLDGSDNFATRQLLNRACQRAGIRLVSGAAERFDGQVAVFDFAHQRSPCYACVQPPAAAADSLPPDCATLGVFAPLTATIGSLMAGEAIKLVAGSSTETLRSRMLIIDLATMRTQIIAIDRAADCPVCGR